MIHEYLFHIFEIFDKIFVIHEVFFPSQDMSRMKISGDGLINTIIYNLNIHGTKFPSLCGGRYN